MSLFDGLLWWVPLGRAPEITAADLAAALGHLDGAPADDLPPLLFDMRTPREHADGHVPGARRITVPELKAALEAGTLDDAGRRCVALCLSAHRSLPAVRLLRKHGRADAVHLAGGMRAWWAAGLPTEKG